MGSLLFLAFGFTLFSASASSCRKSSSACAPRTSNRVGSSSRPSSRVGYHGGVVPQPLVRACADQSSRSADRIWGTGCEQGAVLARTDNQRGPQADILGPGTAFIPFAQPGGLSDVKPVDQFVVPDGEHGLLTARDGDPMPAGQYVAPAWKEGTEKSMLDATSPLSSGGVKGPQLYVLTPAIYPRNTYPVDRQG